MPELAEVEFYRRQWDRGLRKTITSVQINAEKRLFRGTNPEEIVKTLTGSQLLESKAHGKQMLFRFSKDAWLGIHLGMTGKLQIIHSQPAEKHDHLVLHQRGQSLVFSDPRQFGRVRFYVGKAHPPWWTRLPTGVLEKQFTFQLMLHFLQRHRKAPIKAVLLMQHAFPGIGNWMADEILWQAKIDPRVSTGKLNRSQARRLHQKLQFICREALRTVAQGHGEYGKLPVKWLFHHRWTKGGHCPRDGTALQHATVGGRTTCWCPSCQKQ